MRRFKIYAGLFFTLFSLTAAAQKKTAVKSTATVGKVWSAEKANAWYSRHKWLTGADYIPANAINQ